MINCPICNNVLCNTYSGNVIHKQCIKIDHRILVTYIGNDLDNISYTYYILQNKYKTITWDYVDKDVFVGGGTLPFSSNTYHEIDLPWFDPDFSDIKKLKYNIKTYTILS
jgi:hypothetical protein